MTFDEILDIDNIKLLYEEKISVSPTKGVDGVSSCTFHPDTEFAIIQRKCLNGSYKFSSYLEKLVSKGAKKNPRVLSVATVRDRLTLTALKEYLNCIYADCINRKLPNNRVGEIFIHMRQNPKSQFLKTDIKGFYENIDHLILVDLLRKRITDTRVLSLIEKAIKTPTVCFSFSKEERENLINDRGIPQGLAISNILAEIYLSDIDEYMNKTTPFYSRYVDDIMIIAPKRVNEMKTILRKNLSNKNLRLNKEKTQCGRVKNGVLFLGYWITPNIIAVPENKISLLLTRIAGIFTEYEKLYDESNLRPIYFRNDSEGLKDFFIETLNKKITGAKSLTKRYGWIAYYSQITDLSLLYRIDKTIKKFCCRSAILGLAVPDNLKSIHRSYFEIKYNYNNSDYIYNYDIIDSVLKKRKELEKRNLIYANRSYSDEQIINQYEKLKLKELSSYEKDIDFMNGSTSG
ncbi:reverse transcriptase domain-containing protein [Bacteroides reticulotermitis]|uniref:reverse transcriptase domain-containing protein n=1 Tax=Bacteroides reticulotermitis TaxID=1133319 RepID=UPI003A887972